MELPTTIVHALHPAPESWRGDAEFTAIKISFQNEMVKRMVQGH